jgi:glyoxylase-like metal-dependent hydrolase (beta-lactamase superfamily II)
MRILFAWLIVAVFSWPLSAAAQAANDPAAVALVEQAIAAHRLGPVKVRLSYRGTIAGPDQSAAPDGPHGPHPWSLDIAFDETAQAFALSADLGIDGGFSFPRHVGFANGRGFATRYTGEYDPVTEMPAEANGQLPHLLLRTVLKNGQGLRIASDASFDAVAYRLAAGGENLLLFDRRTHLLKEQRRAAAPSAFGDRSLALVYGPYRRVGGVMVPEAMAFRFTTPALGKWEYSLDLVQASAAGPTPAELVPPAGSRPRTPVSTDFAVERYGDAFLLRNAGTEGQFSYNVLVVPFADHVVVVEAALNDATSRKVVEEVARLIPGKPIRTLVQTHHHGDHIGGIRTYIADGVQILAPSGMRGFIDRIAKTHSQIAPDALAAAPKSAVIDEVATDRTITDATNEMRLLTFPNSHSGQMLVVYLPRQQLIYQGDLISAGELPLYSTSTEFLAWLRATKVEVTTLAGLHGRTVSGSELDDLMSRGELNASPRSER